MRSVSDADTLEFLRDDVERAAVAEQTRWMRQTPRSTLPVILSGSSQSHHAD
jgi:hypothetical protein